jgi:hypothetical protein
MVVFINETLCGWVKMVVDRMTEWLIGLLEARSWDLDWVEQVA